MYTRSTTGILVLLEWAYQPRFQHLQLIGRLEAVAWQQEKPSMRLCQTHIRDGRRARGRWKKQSPYTRDIHVMSLSTNGDTSESRRIRGE